MRTLHLVALILVAGLVALPVFSASVPKLAPRADVEFILLPLAFIGAGDPPVEVHGSAGTIWRGEVWVSNRSGQTVSLIEWVQGQFETPAFANDSVQLADPVLDRTPDPGVILSPLKTVADSLTFSNRVFEITRHAQPQGIEIPVVRDNDFRSGETSILAVPAGQAVRSALRVYGIPDSPQQVDLQLRADFISTEGNVLASTLLTPQARNATFVDVYRPGYAAIYDLAAAFPILQTVPQFHIRLTRTSGSNRYWAMTSVTDNVTQQVLIITPQ